MARQPINIHVFLYRKNQNYEFEFAILQRSTDEKCWQGVSGGVEEGETHELAALRESYEEVGTPLDSTIYRMDTISYLRADIFSEHINWGKNIVVVPMYFFAMPYDGEIVLSNEHKNYKWCSYEDAENLIYWHDQKVGLWELNERLKRGNLIR